MDAKDYLKMCLKICADYEGVGNCNGCPLHGLGCGIPKEPEEIDKAIDIVEHYNERTYPFGRCSNCGREFNSEIISECGATFYEDLKGMPDKERVRLMHRK